jgi:uncharacterized protein (DUF4213/DUF364 family)
MILELAYEMAGPSLKNRMIADVRIGMGLMAVALDNGLIGVTYVLNSEIQHGCSVIPQAGNLMGMKAEDVAEWAVKGDNVISRALGLAVLNSVAELEETEPGMDHRDADAVFAADIRPGDTIGVIGHIGPVIARLQGRENRILVFERDESKGTEGTYPESAQPQLLPECQIVFVTSSSLINGTLEVLLKCCTHARDIVMVGSSTPLYPRAFSGTGVTALSGTIWLPENGQNILAGVSQCAGIKQLMKFGRKVSVKVPQLPEQE